MKLYPECASCMLQRALLFAEDQPEDIKFELVRRIASLYSKEFTSEKTTTELAYLRNKIVDELIGERDHMRKLKDRSLSIALNIYPKLKSILNSVKNEKERLFTAMKIALTGNLLEFGAKDHKPKLNNLEAEVMKCLEEKPYIDDSQFVLKKIMNSKNLLYVTDNTPELVFDKVFIEELSKHLKVFVSPLSKPVQDDASLREIKIVGIDKIPNVEIIPRGDFIGICFDRATPEFISVFNSSDFVIAKGMGCYETLVDYKDKLNKKVGILMKVKCSAVAKDISASIGASIIKVL